MEKETPTTLVEEIRGYPRWFSSIFEIMETRIAPIEEARAALYEEESAEITRLEGLIPDAQEAVNRAKQNIEKNALALMEQEARERFRDLYERYEITSAIARSGFVPCDMDGLKIRLRESLQNLREIQDISLPELRAQRDADDEESREKIHEIRSHYEEMLRAHRDDLSARCEAAQNDVLLAYDALRDPETHTELPTSVRFGICTFPVEGVMSHFSGGESFNVPYEVAMDPSVAIALLARKGTVAQEKFLEGATIGSTLRILESFPKGKLQVAVCSSDLSALSRLTALHHSLLRFGLSLAKEPYNTTQEYSTLFQELEEQGNALAATMLEKGRSSLAEMIEAGETEEPYRLIVLHRCLKDFNITTMKRLKGCLGGFARCGILFLFVEEEIPAEIAPFVHTLRFEDGLAHEEELNITLTGIDHTMDELEIYDFVKRYAGGEEA